MILSILGIIIGLGCVVLGQILEGGHLEQLMVPTAAMIVGGGTLGATMLSCTMAEMISSLKFCMRIYLSNPPNLAPLVHEITELANIARKDGILGLEGKSKEIKHPFLAQYLRYLIDGYDPNVIKEMMEDAMHHTEEAGNAAAKVYETGGGFSPTVGIIGAVLGLIHVMSNLSDSSKLGSGIAVAFVATVYGVASANLVLLPMANKIKRITKADTDEMNLIYTGLCAIQAGLNPRVIEERLNNLIGVHGHGDQKKAA